MHRQGHPVAGAVTGALFFFFIGLTLMLFNVIPLAGAWLAFPLVGLVLGGIWGAWAPLGRKRPSSVGFTPIVPLGDPTGRNWTVRPATGEVAQVPHENALGLQPMPVDLEGAPTEQVPPPATPSLSPWAPEPDEDAGTVPEAGDITIVPREEPPPPQER